MKSTYHGSCHCKVVRFTAALDLSQGAYKCNCTICWKQRVWNAAADPGDFNLLAGAEALADYAGNAAWGVVHHRFCRNCGIATHNHGEREGGGGYVNVHLAALDDLPVAVLLAAPVTYRDGLNDRPDRKPAEIRHL